MKIRGWAFPDGERSAHYFVELTPEAARAICGKVTAPFNPSELVRCTIGGAIHDCTNCLQRVDRVGFRELRDFRIKLGKAKKTYRERMKNRGRDSGAGDDRRGTAEVPAGSTGADQDARQSKHR